LVLDELLLDELGMDGVPEAFGAGVDASFLWSVQGAAVDELVLDEVLLDELGMDGVPEGFGPRVDASILWGVQGSAAAFSSGLWLSLPS
jgi:hypothetical protein